MPCYSGLVTNLCNRQGESGALRYSNRLSFRAVSLVLSILNLCLSFQTEVLSKETAKENPYDAQIKCSIIASRIIRGDNVSAKDRRFLMENDPHLYLVAILLRVEKEDPEEYKSITDDEDGSEGEGSDSSEGSGSAEGSGSGEAAGSAPGDAAAPVAAE